MYEQEFTERHKLGLERLTGGNRGLVFTNERRATREVATEEGEPQTVEVWVYDVYEVDDARTAASTKNAVITAMYPLGDEPKLLRKAVARLLKAVGEYDTADNAEFKRYHETAEALEIGAIRGSSEASEPTEEELLAKAKAAVIDAIAEHDASANVNAFTVGGIPMWLNHDQRSRLSASLAVCTDAEMTKYFGGCAYTFPVETWRQMLAAVELYADTCQTVTEAHKAAVAAMSSLAEVAAFDLTAGYPDKLTF